MEGILNQWWRPCANRSLKEGEKEARATQAAPTKGTCPRIKHSPGHSSLTIYKDRPWNFQGQEGADSVTRKVASLSIRIWNESRKGFGFLER